MYAAHFALSLGLTRWAPRAHPLALLTAGAAPDLAFGALLATRVERLDSPSGTPFGEWHIVAPYSHGGATLATAIAVVIIGTMMARVGQKLGRTISVLGAVVLLHLLGDWLVDPSGLQLLGADGGSTGLQLWRNAPVAAMSFEIAGVVIGLLAFLRARRDLAMWAHIALIASFAWLTWASTVGQRSSVAPPDFAALSMSYLLQEVITIAGITFLASRIEATA